MVSSLNMIRKYNPWTQELIFECPQAGAAEFIQALQKVKQAQEAFKKTDLHARYEILRRWAEVIVERKEELVRSLAIEQGLPESFVLTEMVESTQKFIENLSLEVRLFAKPETLSPAGVIGISSSWPMSFMWMSQWIAQGIAAGNGLIVKASALAPISAQKISQILSVLEVPKGLVEFVYGGREELNSLLAGHPGIQGFIYSGHHSRSSHLIETAAQRRKKTQFYLGGKNSSLIHPEFDFESQMDKVLRPALMGQGQLGVNSHRFFVLQSVEKKFYEAVRNYMSKIHRSSGPQDESLWTPLISFDRAEVYRSHLPQIGVDQGKFIFGGEPSEGQFVTPVFTQDMSNCSELQQDEVRGPLFIVTAVKYTYEMVKWANTGYLGQSALFWGPEEKSKSILSQLNVGQVLYQDWGRFLSWGTPIKQSFYGVPDVKWSGSFYSDVRKFGV